MKKIFIAMMMICISGAVSAQKIAADKVPAPVMTAFKAKFPDAGKTTWEMENGNYEASFKNKSIEISAVFDPLGNWIETETTINKSDLPAGVITAMEKNYPGYEIEEVCRVNNTTNGNCYEVEVEKDEKTTEVLFTPDGKIISTKAEDDDD